MELRTEIFVLREDFESFHVHRFGFERAETYSYIGTFTGCSDSIGKFQTVIRAERGKVYSNNNYLVIAVFGEGLNLIFYVFKGT